MMDLERDQLRTTYEVSRLGFAILATALVLACFTALVELLPCFDRDLYRRIVQFAWYPWIDLPIVWGSLIGTTLLWGRWEHASWQRRSGLLLAMCLVDVVLWVLDHSRAWGRGEIELDHEWLRGNLGLALGWAEFALLASLSSDYLGHLGVDHARETARSVRSMVATGAVLWIVLFWERTDWAVWPLKDRPIRSLETLLLWLGWHLIWTITVLQVTALVISATHQSRRVLEEMAREDAAVDPLRSRSNPLEKRDGHAADRDGLG